MGFISTPIEFKEEELSSISIKRGIEDRIQMLDNLVELIVFTPRGSVSADLDFGFEYWNYEYSNIYYRAFNSHHSNAGYSGLYNDTILQECQDSIKRSLEMYEPQLKHIDVLIEINALNDNNQDRRRKVFSKYEVSVTVAGVLDDGLGMVRPYEKKVVFFMEPTIKQISI